MRPFSAVRAQTSSTADSDTTLTVALLGSSSWKMQFPIRPHAYSSVLIESRLKGMHASTTIV